MLIQLAYVKDWSRLSATFDFTTFSSQAFKDHTTFLQPGCFWEDFTSFCIQTKLTCIFLLTKHIITTTRMIRKFYPPSPQLQQLPTKELVKCWYLKIIIVYLYAFYKLWISAVKNCKTVVISVSLIVTVTVQFSDHHWEYAVTFTVCHRFCHLFYTVRVSWDSGSLAQPDHYFSLRHLSIRDYMRLLEIGSGTLPIGQLWQHLD